MGGDALRMDRRAARAIRGCREDRGRKIRGRMPRGLSAESRVVTATAAEAANLFGRIARCFDLSIVRQNEPGKLPYERLLIEAALFDSGRPVVIVPYIQTQGLS